jgi:hypothetical protein
MSAEITSSDAVEQYLRRLRHALRHARSDDREDYVSQIGEHLSETRIIGDSLDELIRRMGSPETLAQEFHIAERVKLSTLRRFARWFHNWWVLVTVLIVLLAAIPVYSWASRYQPLSTYMEGGYRDRVVSFNGAPAKKLVGGSLAPITWKLNHGHYRLSILFDASNMNSLSVEISPLSGLVPGFPSPVTWHLENSSTGALSPFVSAQVKGDQDQEIVFSETYVCKPWPKGSPNATGASTVFITTLPVVESFWGFRHTVQLAVQPFYLEFAGDCFNG